ncbi:Ig-like domain-containing protein, partial [uncultured Croceitalea sp.]|uniref:Ig-like domain-containing protein n=1 Tax=uncultured Croceitalea sp. TaxID=1798908 RepID=UPI003305D86F
MKKNHPVLLLTLFLLFSLNIYAQNPQDLGEWSDPIPFNLVPVSVANLPDGRLLTWSSRYRESRFDAADGFTYTEIFDPNVGVNGQSMGLKITDNNHNMFCSGINNLADGKIMVAGGGSAPRTTIYDPMTESWTPSNNMNVARAYQGNVTLANGEVFTIGGQWDGGSTGKMGEIWTADNGWKSLPGIPMEVLFNDNDLLGGHNRPADHAWVWAAPNGKVFHAGPSEDMHWLDVSGNGSVAFAGKRADDVYSISGTTVMYDIGKILKVGGSIGYGNGAPASDKSYVIDINNENNVLVTSTLNDISFSRTHHNSIVLPNGEVLIVGGLSTARTFFDGGSRFQGEIWNPQTNMWRTVAGMQVPRNYHSVSILMMDGRVFTGGGGLCNNCSVNHEDAELFSPPYLFDSNGNLADRPEISAPETAEYNQVFQVQSNDVIDSFAFIRMSSATHSVNNEQRRVPVSFTLNGSTYSLNIPDSNAMPPGYYMLFGLDENGVPSIAEAVRVLPNVIAVTGIELNPSNIELPEGRTASLNHLIIPSNATDQVVGWNSEDLSIAMVDDNGVVTAMGIGTTVITVTTNDGSFTAQTTITVVEGDGLCFASGEILMERYDGIGGVLLEGLFNSPNYPDNPSSTLELNSFEIPNNVADNYGVRVSGYLCAPETGTYYFWVSGDDESRLNLSTDNSTSNIATIANVPGWSSSREWNKFPEQKSVGIQLVQGLSYYIEAFMKEAGGGDNLAVGWRRPSDGDGGVPTEIIPGNVLSSVDCTGPDGVIPEYSINGEWQSGQNILEVTEGIEIILSGLPNSNGPHTIIDPQGNSFSDNHDLGSIDETKTGVYTVQNQFGCETTIEIILLTIPVTGVNVTPTALNLVEGETDNLTANISPSDADDISVTWSSSDENVATIDESGQVTAVSVGTTTITATTNDGGFIDQAEVVVLSNLPPKPTQSSPIIVDSGARKVWVVNPDNNTVSVLNSDTLEFNGEFAVAADPVSIAKDAQENIWVTCRDAGVIQILNSQGTLLNTINLGRGSQPYGVVNDPLGEFLYVSLFASNKILKISASSQTIVDELSIFAKPRAMAITADGLQLFVTQFITENNNGKIAKINLTDFELSSNINIDEDSFSPNSSTAAKGIANYLGGIAIQPESDKAWFTAKKDNTLTGEFRSGEDLNFATTIRAMISNFSIESGQENAIERVDIDNHNLPTGIIVSPLGNYVFITMLTNNRIIVLDANSGLEVIRRDVGFAPSGITIDPTNNRLFVKNFLSRSVHVFDANDLIAQGTRVLPLISEVGTVSSELLTNQVLQGKQMFYNARDSRMTQQENSDAGYISCASCHIDGTYDGQTWDFTQRGEGLRNTISLRGRAGTGHGNVHWTGNFDEIHDFENDIRFAFGGTGFMTDQDFFSENRENPMGGTKENRSAELDALNAYIESLNTFDKSPNKNENGTMTPAALQGKTLFNNLKCANCHGGEAFTNSSKGLLYDIGTVEVSSGKRLGRTLRGFDVPTLRDVWTTAPYLHDGSAATVKDAITRHAIGTNLSQNDLELLEAYLLQLDGTEAPATEGVTFELQVPSTATTENSVSFSVLTDISNIEEVIYYVDDVEIGRSSSSPYNLDFLLDTANNYCIYAKAIHQGMATVSKSQTLVITGTESNSDDDRFITLEGEDFVSVQDGEVGNYLAGFQGTGFLDLSANNSFGEWQFESNEVVTTSLTIVYNSGFLFNRLATLQVNGNDLGEIEFTSSANCFSWQSVQLDNIALVEGINTIRVTTTSNFGGVDIDFLEVEIPPKPVTGIIVDPITSEIYDDETIQLTGTV